MKESGGTLSEHVHNDIDPALSAVACGVVWQRLVFAWSELCCVNCPLGLTYYGESGV